MRVSIRIATGNYTGTQGQCRHAGETAPARARGGGVIMQRATHNHTRTLAVE